MSLMYTHSLTVAAGCNALESIQALRDCFPNSFGLKFSLVAALVIGLEAEAFEYLTSVLDIDVNQRFSLSTKDLDMLEAVCPLVA